METPDNLPALLQKYTDGHCTAREQAIVEQWYASLRIETPAGTRGSDPDLLWEKIAARTQVTTPRSVRRLWLGVAAVAATIVGAVVFLFPQRTAVSQTADAGNIRQITLPDGSLMWLSAGSKVHYSSDFTRNRQVDIESGEVFFDVKRDDAHAFTVNARGTQTLVLGTAFRVRAGKQVEVTVVSGKVKVTGPGQQPVVVMPREMVALNSKVAPAVLQLSCIPAASLAAATARESWHAQRADLNDVSTGELAQLLESVYNVRIHFREARLRDCRNTISIDTGRPLTEILDKLKLINHIEYIITNEGIEVFGTGCHNENQG